MFPTEVPFYRWESQEGLLKSITEVDRGLLAGAMEYVPAHRLAEVLESSTISPWTISPTKVGGSGGYATIIRWAQTGWSRRRRSRCRACGMRGRTSSLAVPHKGGQTALVEMALPPP